MPTYYIRTDGNNANTGTANTSGGAWATLVYATSHTVSGDTISVQAGTYTETAQIVVPTGISIIGVDKTTTIIKSTVNTQFTPVITLASLSEGTNGNQTIANLTFDGQSLASQFGIQVVGRSNVIIHDCVVKDFYERGVTFTGVVNNQDVAPTIFATGNQLYNCTITNSSGYIGGNGTGCLNIGGQDGLLVHDNTITQVARVDGSNGWPIKYTNDGFLKNVKIYNNVLTKKVFVGNYGGDSDWDFVLELWNILGGVQFYGNTVQGGLDWAVCSKGASSYSLWIHDNTFTQPSLNTKFQDGIILERGCEGAIIENNSFDKYTCGVRALMEYFGPPQDPHTVYTGIVIRRNLFSNMGQSGQNGNQGFGIQFDGGGQGAIFDIQNIQILNNTFITTPGAAGLLGIVFSVTDNSGTSTIKNVYVENNILMNYTLAWFWYNSGNVPMDTLVLKNNDCYNIGNGTTPTYNVLQPTNVTNSGNITSNPSLDGSFKLQSGSPCIDAGVYVGYQYNGSAPDMGFSEFGSPIVDTTAPAVTSVFPVNGATGIAIDSSITLSLSEIVDVNTINSSNTFITGVSSAIIYFGDKVILTPLSNLGLNTTYTINLTTGVKDLSGNAVASNFTSTFTTTSVINTPPTVNAGVNQTITLPTNSVSLSGSATLGTGSSITSYTWSKLAGGTGTITSPSATSTTITGMVAGVYQFQLVAVDNNGLSGSATVIITVRATTGTDYAIWNPADKASNVTLSNGNLTATGDGSNIGMVRANVGVTSGKYWWQITVNTVGSSEIGIAKGAETTGNYLGSTAGGYGLSIDGFKFHNGSSQFYVGTSFVNGDIVNIALDLDAGTLTYYKNGTSLGVAFTGLSGLFFPAYSSVFSPSLVTANFGATSFAYAPPAGYTRGIFLGAGTNTPPTVDAGTDKVVVLPTSTTSLTGTSSSSSGTIVSNTWTQVSGTSATIASPSSLTTSITGLSTVGVRIFRLTSIDSVGGTAYDDVQVTVNSANIAPTANAGPDQNITLPTNTIVMNGSGSDIDGTVVSQVWSQVSGPNTAIVTTPSSYTTTITNLIAGTYTFRLTVTDNGSLTGSDDMITTVNSAGQVTIKRKITILP